MPLCHYETGQMAEDLDRQPTRQHVVWTHQFLELGRLAAQSLGKAGATSVAADQEPAFRSSHT